MRKFFFLFVIAAATAIFLNTGCTDDPIIQIDPTITLVQVDPTSVRPDYPTDDFSTSDLNGFSYIAIRATAGTDDLESLTVLEDGVKVDASRLYFRDLNTNTDVTVQNPILLLGFENEALWEIGIDPQDDFSTKTYSVQIEDAGGATASVSIDITTFDPGTPIENTLTGKLLLNQAGPAGTGALDLDTGEGTGTTGAGSADADIRDWGINLGLPVDQNWLRQIGPINGTEVRVPGGLPGDFKFTDIATKEEIQGYFAAGAALPNDGGSKSDPVEVGDFFVVKSANGSRFYFLECTEVNVTPADNADYYEFRDRKSVV